MPILNGIYYTVHEGGGLEYPPVVLIHGAGADHSIWAADFRRLPGRRVIALDLPGHGRSLGNGSQSVYGYARQILSFLLESHIFQAVYVGHGMGAAIALAIAAAHPDQAAGVGVISGGAYLNVPPDLSELFNSPGALPLAIKRWQDLSTRSDPPSPAWLKAVRSTRPSVLVADWRACSDFDLRSEVYRVSAPVWVAHGSHDRLVPLACAHFLSGQLPQARLQIVPAGEHLLPCERVEETAAGLRKFLAETRPAYIQVEEEGIRVSYWPRKQ